MPAVAIGFGISALFGYFSSRNQANAATQAAAAQTAASKEALDFLKQQAAQTRSDIAPWLATGRGALSKLSYLMGVTPEDAPTIGGPAAAAPPSGPSSPSGGGGTSNQPTPGNSPPGFGSPTNPGGIYGNPGQPGTPDPFLNGAPSLTGPQGPGMNPPGYQQPGPGWPGFFSGNPGGAFFGGDVPGSGGDQTNPGNGRAKAYGAGGQPLSTMGGTPPTTVKMISPDGTEVQDVPADQVYHYKQMGAQVVNS
jgi:hypothetical protein